MSELHHGGTATTPRSSPGDTGKVTARNQARPPAGTTGRDQTRLGRLTLLVAAAYVVMAVLEVVVVDRRAGTAIVWAALATALVLGGIALLALPPAAAGWAHPVGAAVGLFALANSYPPITQMSVANQIVSIALTIVAAGAFFLSSRWLTGFIGVALVGGLVLVAGNPDDLAWDQQVVGATLLFGASAVAVVVYRLRLRALTLDLELQTQRERHQRELERALTAGEAAFDAMTTQYREVDRIRGQLDAVIDAAGEVIVLIDPDGRLVLANRRMAEMFGVAHEDIVGHTLAEIRPMIERVFDDAGPLLGQLTPHSDESIRASALVRQRWPERREFQASSAPVRDERGTFLGRLYVFRDVTAERQVDRLKTELVSMVSHELRTPLTSILGYLELLEDGDYGPLTEPQLTGLGVVQASADRLLKLIDNLLDVSRIQSGAIDLRLRPVELGPLLRHVTMTMGPQFEEKDQRLDVEVPADLPPVQADADRLQQIVLNLLSNATKYTAQGGSIAIVASREDGRVRVDVRDSGIGIPVDEQERIFERFYRSPAGGSRRQPGTGLGLPITRGLVEAQAGEISVTSAPGEGSTFTFWLPASSSAPTTALASGERSTTVLVVSDGEGVVEDIRRVLADQGEQTLGATTADEAVELARLEGPGLVLIDVVLSPPGSLALLRRLAQDPTTSGTPAALISVLSGAEDGPRFATVACVDARADATRLRDSVERALDRAAPGLVLAVDCDELIRRSIGDLAAGAGFSVEFCERDRATRLALDRHPAAILIGSPAGADPIDVVGRLRSDPATEEIVVVVVVDGGVQRGAVAAATDLLPPTPVDANELAEAIARAVAGG
jgi:PAS domain S-box-containing protein